MKLLALLSDRDDAVSEVKAALRRYTIYPLKTLEEFEDLHTNIPINLFLIDTVSYKLSKLEDILNRLGNGTVILITPERLDEFTMENIPQSVYDCVEAQSIHTGLPAVVERALQRQRHMNVENLLEKSNDVLSGKYTTQTQVSSFYGQRGFESLLPGKLLQVLVDFAKVLTANFDMRKLFNHFMDSVMGISRVSKMSVMLRDKEGFHVRTHYGLDPYIAENFRLRKDSALATWLTKTGRIRHKPLNPPDTTSLDIKSEMELLECIFSFPIVYKGKLIGIFNIDDKITEEPFYKEELEIIYVLCNYLAAAVKDIDLYHQILYQKEFTKNILSSMSSGVIVIDNDEKITVLNQRASEFLNLNPSEMVGRDLRNLPSPLGDILYETMVTGTSYKRHEVEVLKEKLPIGINSYRLLDKNQSPIGAAIVFTDLSDLKRFEEEKRKADRLEAINTFTARIAHEIKNPLTAIKTFAELLDERYGDEEFKNFFNTTVRQSIHQLDNLTDKLVISSIPLYYSFKKIDIDEIIKDAINQARRVIPQSVSLERIEEKVKRPVFISADRRLLTKALYYLLLLCTEKTKDNSVSIGTNVAEDNIEISISFTGKALSDEEKQQFSMSLTDMEIFGIELNVPISKKIIEEHSGSIQIESDAEGNVFKVTIPIPIFV